LAGIYLHIPFCRQACHYCNFHFSTSLQHKDAVLNAMVKEIGLRSDYLQGQEINTIYFGGGTPSILPIEDIDQLLKTIHQHFTVSEHTEITLEANPDDINPGSLVSWKHAGINRFSIGVQSFDEQELRWMNRAHGAKQARECIHLCRNYGFENFSIDLIYGSPLLSDEQWEKNVRTATDLNIPHLSCYALTVEEKTPLHKQIALNKSPDTDNEKQARQFLLLMNWLKDSGYRHYEVSNFAKPGYQSRHNSSYWKGIPYLGIGPSAHSFNGTSRSWNVSNNAAYARSVHAGNPSFETEILTREQKINEQIMISVRTSEGLDVSKMPATDEKYQNRLQSRLHQFVNNGLFLQSGTVYRLTDEGFLRADAIAADLFI
jgi:oxygen-independent coproporphyrinogen-3 oxidase